MKMIFVIAALAVSASAFSASVKITSFNYVRTSQQDMFSPLAELCGTVEGVATTAFVKVVVDQKSSKPANYNTVVDTDGRFCVAVITYRGTAEATVMGATTKASIK